MSKPRQRFAQHFLQDTQVIQQLVAAIAPMPTQHLVEIGPGRGALTKLLLQHCGKLDALEIDQDLVMQLKTRFATQKIFYIYQADALTFDFAQLQTDRPLRLIGNLPYNISTPLLFWIFNYLSIIQDMVFMLQKEVVNRIIATPATTNYGRLSVMIQYFCQVEALFEVGAHAFYPRPKVTSSVIRLVPYASPPVRLTSIQHFSQIVQTAFAQRRKTLRNALKGWLDEDRLQAQGIQPQRRAETLTLEEFAKLANCYTQCQYSPSR